MDWIANQDLVFLAFLAGLFTWSCTIVGAAIVFSLERLAVAYLTV